MTASRSAIDEALRKIPAPPATQLPKLLGRPSTVVICFALACLLFWSLRVLYWQTVAEQPFSDMADLIRVAAGVRRHGSFAYDRFWQSYRPPVVPLMMAITSFHSGTFNLAAWQVWQTIFVFASLLCLARELLLATKNPWASITLIISVAVTRPSIFWSYKAATESVAEGFVYATMAMALLFIRKQSLPAALAAGVVGVAAALARPSFAPVIALLAVVTVGYGWLRYRTSRRLVLVGMMFLLGVGLAWAPWLGRSYYLYHHFVPFTTQGPYSFLWEWGGVKVPSRDGTTVIRDVNAMTQGAPHRFANDYEAAQYGNRAVRAWLRENWRLYLRNIPTRLWRQITDRTEYLTKVPRDKLFAIDVEPLLDKSAPAVLLGFVGLVLFAGAHGVWAAPLAIFPAVLWLFSALFLSYPRMFDPYSPLVLYGIFLIPLSMCRLAASSRGRLVFRNDS